MAAWHNTNLIIDVVIFMSDDDICSCECLTI